MQTDINPKINTKKRWPLPCTHNKEICSTCKERIVKKIAFDIERYVNIILQ